MENATVDTSKLELETQKLKKIKYNFIPGHDIICPKCSAKNNIKIEVLEGNTGQAECICGNCGYKKIIQVEYLDSKVKEDIKNKVIKAAKVKA